MEDIRDVIDEMSKQWKRERANTQMTLDKLIKELEQLPEDFELEGLSDPHSYRGYYSDLAFERSKRTTAGELLKLCKSCMGKVFEGYKGGEFMMGEGTPVWIASYGTSAGAMKIISILPNGLFEEKEDNLDE